MSVVIGLEYAALDKLKQVERGEVGVSVAGRTWDYAYCANVTFVTDDGWVFIVFNDCDEWDYLDTVIDPMGHIITYNEMEKYPELANYEVEDADKFRQAKLIKAVR